MTENASELSLQEAEALAAKLIQLLQDLYTLGGRDGRHLVMQFKAMTDDLQKNPDNEATQTVFLLRFAKLQYDTFATFLRLLKKFRTETAKRVRALGNATDTAMSARKFAEALDAMVRSVEAAHDAMKVDDQRKSIECVEAMREAQEIMRKYGPVELRDRF